MLNLLIQKKTDGVQIIGMGQGIYQKSFLANKH